MTTPGPERPGAAVHPAALGFAAVADDYERSRPSYPAQAIARWAKLAELEPGALVVDVGAGTGKLTRLLVGAGASVVAVEPVRAMAESLHASLPGVDVRDGTAERLPVADACARAVTAGQAFHWFDGPAALAEMHRVLAARGTLAVFYNDRDTSVPWVAAVDAVFRPLRGEAPSQRSGEWRDVFATTALFTELQSETFPNTQTLTPAEMVARVRSISFVGAMPMRQQARLLDDVARVLAEHPDTAGSDRLELPQTTTLYWCRRR
jgi:ubiquinone/menaquinone biosynthesis C-methylase UbiE